MPCVRAIEPHEADFYFMICISTETASSDIRTRINASNFQSKYLKLTILMKWLQKLQFPKRKYDIKWKLVECDV